MWLASNCLIHLKPSVWNTSLLSDKWGRFFQRHFVLIFPYFYIGSLPSVENCTVSSSLMLLTFLAVLFYCLIMWVYTGIVWFSEVTILMFIGNQLWNIVVMVLRGVLSYWSDISHVTGSLCGCPDLYGKRDTMFLHCGFRFLLLGKCLKLDGIHI